MEVQVKMYFGTVPVCASPGELGLHRMLLFYKLCCKYIAMALKRAVYLNSGLAAQLEPFVWK